MNKKEAIWEIRLHLMESGARIHGITYDFVVQYSIKPDEERKKRINELVKEFKIDKSEIDHFERRRETS